MSLVVFEREGDFWRHSCLWAVPRWGVELCVGETGFVAVFYVLVEAGVVLRIASPPHAPVRVHGRSLSIGDSLLGLDEFRDVALQ